MRRFLTTLTVVTAAVLLAACEMQMTATLHTSDVRAAAAGDQNINTSATLYLPVTSVDECKKETKKIVAIMEGIVEPFQPRGCERRDANSYLLADVNVPLFNRRAQWDRANSLFGFIAQYDGRDSSFHVFLMMNLDIYATLDKRVRREFYQSLNLDDSTFTIVFSNDERRDIEFVAKNAFVDGRPVIQSSNAIRTQDRISVVLSNVSTAFLGQNGAAPTFVLVEY